MKSKSVMKYSLQYLTGNIQYTIINMHNVFVRKKRNYLYATSLLTLVLLVSSCGKEQNIHFQEFASIENSTWNMKDVKSFEFEINDTNTLYDFYFNLRNGKDYQFANIHVFYKLISPDGRKMSAKSEFVLARPDGKWLGKSISGTIIENSMKFDRNKKFPVMGKYTFEFIHGMRPKDLEHISDIGLKIKKSDEQK